MRIHTSMTNLYQVAVTGKEVVYLITGSTKEEAQIQARNRYKEQFYISVQKTRVLSTEKF